ncbi:MAG: double-strand break repair protein AddB [Alphaproteobacteria bacterium]|nr:double-strand break repair protein AddB [Alphaproteobacteria bacterium]
MKEQVSFIPAHLPFLETLAQFLLSTYDQKELASSVIFLPTYRACQKLENILCNRSQGKALLLPRLIPLGGIDGEDLALSSLSLYDTMMGLPPLVSAEERLALLTQEIQKFYRQKNQYFKTSQACALAKDLLHLIDQVQLEGLDFSRLKDLVPEDYASHWQLTVEFLEIIAEKWPSLIKKLNKTEPAEYQRLLLEFYARLWEQTPPSHPVIGAGSTGSIPATARLLKVIQSLPEGHLILPNLDPSLDGVPPSSHPQHTMYRLLETIGIEAQEVGPLVEEKGEEKRDLLKGIFDVKSKPLPLEKVKTAINHLHLLECSSQQEEATVIALAIREHLEKENQFVSFVTANRSLARRVVQELKRWNIQANDSGGIPLSQTAVGVFCLLTAEWVQEKLSLSTLLATLKHPYAYRFKRFAHVIEKKFLRQGISFDHIDPLLLEDIALQEEYKIIQNALEKGRLLATQENINLKNLWMFHKELLSLFTEKKSPWFGETEESEVFDGFIQKLEENLITIPLQKGEEYGDILTHFFTTLSVRKKFALHPRLSILGLIEARLVPADLVILGDLNEGSWPGTPSIDPWFNQSMRKQFGLPEHDRRVGLSALDFVQACAAPHVLLTRSLRVQGTPTVPSRFLTRLQSYLKRYNLSLQRKGELLYYAQILYAPKERILLGPPTPRPPFLARPRSLSITEITTLIHDPYSLYAKKILHLKPLKPLEEKPGRLEFGLFVHDVLEVWFKNLPLMHETGIAIGKEKFSIYFQEPLEHNLWWYRFENILQWIIKQMPAFSLEQSWQETRGLLEFSLEKGSFSLVGKADRIDETNHGMVIVDYKTGTPPTKKEIEYGLSPQLPLEAIILKAGGFKDIPRNNLSSLSFWHLIGDREGGEIIEYSQDLDSLVMSTKEGLGRLLEAFDEEETAYLSIPYQTSLYGDYHHLARIKEWSLNGGNA